MVALCYKKAGQQSRQRCKEMPETLADELENDIIFGVYAHGARIIEDRVMERYAAKRHAVRNAFAVLESRGLLVRKPNRGVEVVHFTPDEVDALYDVRIILETSAAERTQLPCAPELTDQLEDIARRHQQALLDKDFRAVFWLNQEFHELQYSCCDNPRLAQLIGNHARTAQPIRVVKYDDAEHMDTIIVQHRNIINAMRGASTADLVDAVRAHLPASAKAYRALYEQRFGDRSAASA